MKSHEKLLAVSLGVGIALGATACGSESPAPAYAASLTTEDLQHMDNSRAIGKGEATSLPVVDPNSEAAKQLKAGIRLIDHQYPNGPEDDKAPLLGTSPIRVDAQVTLSGSKSNYLDNDAACDVIRLDPKANIGKVGGLALGGAENGVFLSWANTEGDTVYLCSFQNMEPADDQGVVLYGIPAQQ